MASEPKYDWKHGAKLDDHSRRKLKVIKEYFSDYLLIRCQLPQQEKFRLAIVDGFCGGGRYLCGTAGSPILFIEQLRDSIKDINIVRVAKGLKIIRVECLFVFCDKSPDALAMLRENVAPLIAQMSDEFANIHVFVEYITGSFEASYPEVRRLIEAGSFQNLIFNLDQYGQKDVTKALLIEILSIRRSVEIFLTFAIQSLITFLEKDDPKAWARKLKFLGLTQNELSILGTTATQTEWLGVAERLVFETFKNSALYVSPFSINNPNGWRYWLLHFVNSYRARQAYNNVLHKNSGEQAHFGRSGLNMHSYDPAKEGQLFLFDDAARQSALNQLYHDIPKLISASGDAMRVSEFYESTYNTTPAHSNEINQAIIENEDLEVLTARGGERRTSRNIAVTDVIRLKRQKSLFPMFRTVVAGKK